MHHIQNKQPIDLFWEGCPIWFEWQSEEDGWILCFTNCAWQTIVHITLIVGGKEEELDITLAPKEQGLWQSGASKADFYPLVVRFADGVEWKNSDRAAGIPIPAPVLPDENGPYFDEFLAAWSNTPTLVQPERHELFWRCGCGQINDRGRTECFVCQRERQWVFDHLDGNSCHNTALEKARNESILSKKRKRALELERQIKKRRMRIAAACTGGVAVLVAVVLIVTLLAIPARHYAAGTAYMELDRFHEAYVEFSAAGNYKDSGELLVEISRRISAETAISAGYRHVVKTNRQGKVDGTGYSLDSQLLVNKWNSIRAVSAGKDHTVGLHYSGTVMAVGNKKTGALDVKSWLRVVQIGAGDGFTIGLQNDGKVLATGLNTKGQCNVNDWRDIVAVSVGNDFTVGLKSDGTVVATGNNAKGQCNVSAWKDVIFIAAGGSHTVGIKADGSLVATGCNAHGECDITDWKDIIAVAAGNDFTVGLRADGTLIAAGDNKREQIDVAEIDHVIAVTAGWDYTIAVQEDGKTVFFGKNEDGEGLIDNWFLSI